MLKRLTSRDLFRGMLLGSVCWLATGLPLGVADASVESLEARLAKRAAQRAPVVVDPSVPSELNVQLEKDWGIKVLSVATNSAGYMVDFRYRITDPVKARPMMDRTIPASLEVAKSGAKLLVPRPPTTGRLRGSAKFPQKDRNYFMLFANPGKHVQSGDKVSVVIGDFRADNLTVR